MPSRTVDINIPPFAGFPKNGLEFLRKLKRNNNRDWFLPRKAEYEQLVQLPMRSLVATLRLILQPEAPEIRIDPIKSVFRLYRDVRFSKDKSPYKTHVAASFDYVSGEGRMARPGFYLHISHEEVLAGGGFYMPMPEQVRAIRTSMAARPEAFLKVVNDPKLKKRFGKLLGERLQRPPKGFGDPPGLSEYLKQKQFYVITNYSPDAPCHAGFARRLASDFFLVLPLMKWLNDAISTLDRREKRLLSDQYSIAERGR
jgi:uncharacterized protein (TIGR02453 family)